MPGTIIVPTDFSTASDAAIPCATDLAKARGAKLLFVHVVEPAFAYGDGNLYYGMIGPDEEALQAMLAKLRPTATGVAFQHRMLNGHPAQRIVELAREEKADMIVIGSHGRRGLGRMLLGSIAEIVVRRAECPVVVVKSPHLVNVPAPPASTGKTGSTSRQPHPSRFALCRTGIDHELVSQEENCGSN